MESAFHDFINLGHFDMYFGEIVIIVTDAVVVVIIIINFYIILYHHHDMVSCLVGKNFIIKLNSKCSILDFHHDPPFRALGPCLPPFFFLPKKPACLSA